ncbi:hypothetical protein MCANPG14_02970 [Mycoplasmopsis canis PG 14]|uniref:Uncharacterized protein n=1 Tax=Mycoplasmopsis canis TaxID=29555 RepID=A0A449ARE8_9BACT|nr:hypothetical protein [Mycoplasmopsis canis]AMD81515.1 hypothetical protein AXW82_03085 [Mycoplasmopsis canis PG 14]EIE39466.1 hypothetical protein MCANPG14_02970 [Mycoplasmopsis canis PG 14]VEU69145.1 Uncharacterised protein [Mycoplasmopsis canis]
MIKNVQKNKKEYIYVETFAEISVKDLILKYQSDKENDKNDMLLDDIYNLLFKSSNTIFNNKNENENNYEYDMDSELNLKMKMSLIEERYEKAVFLKQKINHRKNEKNIIYKSDKIAYKYIYNFSSFMDIFVMPDDSLIIKTSSLLQYINKKDEDFIKKTYLAHLHQTSFYSLENAMCIVDQIFANLYKDFSLDKIKNEEFMKFARANIKNKLKQVSVFNLNEISEEIVDELNIREINYYGDIFEFDQENIRIKATNHFREKIADNLPSKINNNYWDFQLYYSKALAYVIWGYNYHQSCQNALIKNKLSDSFKLKEKGKYYKSVPRSFITIYDTNLVEQLSVIPSALSENLKIKFINLIKEIDKYKNEQKFTVNDRKNNNKSFRESILALWVIIGTSLLSVSGLWQVATWIHDKWIASILDNYNWFISWLILVLLSGIVFISSIIYALIKFIYSYKIFKNNKKILKANEENLKIIQIFYNKSFISENIIDTFKKNSLKIQNINSKNEI